MITAENIEGKFLEYRGYPLVRKENEIYLGDLSAPHFIFMLVMNADEDEKTGTELPNLIMIQLRSPSEEKPVKQTTAKSLTDALETGVAWLNRYNR